MYCKYGALLHKKRPDVCYCSSCVSKAGWSSKPNNSLRNGNWERPCEYCMSQGGTLTLVDNQWIADQVITYSTAHVYQEAPAPPSGAAPPPALTNAPHNQAAPGAPFLASAPPPPVPPGLSLPANVERSQGAASSNDRPEQMSSNDEEEKGSKKEVGTLRMKLDIQAKMLDASIERENFLRADVQHRLKGISSDHHQLMDAMKQLQTTMDRMMHDHVSMKQMIADGRADAESRGRQMQRSASRKGSASRSVPPS